MSARTLERPEIETVRPVAPAPAPRRGNRTKTVPELRLEAQIKPVRRRRLKKTIFERVFLNGSVFVSLAFVSYLGCGLAAQVSAESARQAGFRSAQRADAAVRSGQAINDRLEQISAKESVERWALAHGMRLGAPTHEENQLVARRD